MFLKLLRDPSKKWRVDMYGQAEGERKWLPLFSKVLGLSDESATDGVSPEGIGTAFSVAVEP